MMMRSASRQFRACGVVPLAALLLSAMLAGCTETRETPEPKPSTKAAAAPATETKPETKTEAEPSTVTVPADPEEGPPSVLSTLEPGKWVSLFTGKNLKGWRVVEKAEFEMHGKVEVKDGAIRMGVGMPFTAITWTGDFPQENYEVELEAMRTSGVDIFAATTFPVGEAHVSFIVGGWGDTVVGISSVDDMNASENETTTVMTFDNNTWHRFRIRVTTAKIEAWVGKKQVVDLERKGHTFTLYGGVEPVAPFGVFTWQSEGALRNIRFRRVKPEEK